MSLLKHLVNLNCEIAHKQNVSHEKRECCCLFTSALPAPGIERADFTGSVVGDGSTGMLPNSLEPCSATVFISWHFLVSSSRYPVLN